MRWTARDACGFGIGVTYLLPSPVLFTAFVFVPLATAPFVLYTVPVGITLGLVLAVLLNHRLLVYRREIAPMRKCATA